MSIGNQDHGGVPKTPAVPLGRLNEPFDLGLGEVLSPAKFGVGTPPRHDCSVYGGLGDQLEARFSHAFCPSSSLDCSYNGLSRNSVNGLVQTLVPIPRAWARDRDRRPRAEGRASGAMRFRHLFWHRRSEVPGKTWPSARRHDGPRIILVVGADLAVQFL
jgi:hypothetical protein